MPNHLNSAGSKYPTSSFFITRKFAIKSSSEDDADISQFRQSFLSRIRQSLCHDILDSITLHFNNNVSSDSTKPIVILLGVRGGCDSIGLFHTMLALLRSKNGIHEIDCNSGKSCIPTSCELHVVHFDHQQRGVESDGDRELVKSLCHEHNVPFHCFYWNDSQLKGEDGRFSQDIARKWRRTTSIQLLSKITVSDSYSRTGLILSAHHKDDVEETLLLKMLRGVHITNISGMDALQRYHNENDSSPTIYIGKPMLNVRKKEIEHFLISSGFHWREDDSNSSPKYLRNRVRNELIPLLKDLMGGEMVLGSRLENIETQSMKIKKHISDQTKDELSTMLRKEKDEWIFFINKGENLSLR